MSDTSQGSGWWLASDGKWYPPTSTPGPPTPPAQPFVTDPNVRVTPHSAYGDRVVHPAYRGVSRALAVWVYLSFILVSVTAGLAAAVNFSVITKFNEYWRTPRGSDQVVGHAWLDSIDGGDVTIRLVYIVVLVALIVYVTWSYSAHRATSYLNPSYRKWSRGWTIGGWLIPLANLVLPKLVMNEIERISSARRHEGQVSEDWPYQPLLLSGWIWFVGLLIGLLSTRLGHEVAVNAFNKGPADFSSGAYRNGYVIVLLGLSALITSMVAGISYIKTLSDRLEPGTI